MDLLYPEKEEIFESLVADFTPAKLRSAYALRSPNNPPSQIARRIDADVARLEDLCRAMKFERNTCAPMLRLPVEILGHIIELCARSDPPEQIQARDHPVHPPPVARPPAWLGFIRLGHVCGFLRRVILEMPALWATVAFTLPKGHTEILERARSAPLTINLHPYQAPPDTVISAEAHLLSARVVRVKAGSGQATDMIYDPKKELRELEELDLSAWYTAQNITMDMINLSPLRAPRLRRLKLHNHFIPVNYSSLETLVLAFQNTMPSPSDDAGRLIFHGNALLNMLSRCTSLRRLSLDGMQFEALTPLSASRAAISLPFLKYLRMNSTVTFCRFVWSILVLGWHTCVEVTLTSNPENEAESQGIAVEENMFITELVHHSGEPEAPTITGVRLDYRDWDLRLVLAVTERGAFTAERQGPFREDRNFTLDVCSRRWDQDARVALYLRLLNEMPTHIKLTEVDALALSLPQAIPTTTPEWRHLLAPFNAVRSLVCDQIPPQRGFWDALCPPADSTGATLILPNLRTISILPDESQSMYGTHPAMPDQLVSWEDVSAGLRRRAERKAGIKKIMLGTYWDLSRAVDPKDIHALRSVVPQVVDTREYKDGHLVIPPFDDYSSELWSASIYQ
ncbi:hypothetical protein PENSPDRAFT_756032 [Peniophora sp. CONT]|nr:hypothetical protein PENSPDRAFT_756032 [Peniophora sp. CONT]